MQILQFLIPFIVFLEKSLSNVLKSRLFVSYLILMSEVLFFFYTEFVLSEIFQQSKGYRLVITIIDLTLSGGY